LFYDQIARVFTIENNANFMAAPATQTMAQKNRIPTVQVQHPVRRYKVHKIHIWYIAYYIYIKQKVTAKLEQMGRKGDGERNAALIRTLRIYGYTHRFKDRNYFLRGHKTALI